MPAGVLLSAAAALTIVRVLFVTNLWPDADRPWYGTFVRTQANSIANLGVDVSVLAIRGYAGSDEYRRAARRALALNRRCSFDLVHGHHGYGGLVGRLQLRAPLLVSYTGSDLNTKPLNDGRIQRKSAVEAAIFRRLASVSAATITKSAAMAELLPTHARARNTVIPNGVDLEAFAPLPKREARRRLGWSNEEKAVLYVGDPGKPWKGHDLAQATAAELARAEPASRLRVAWQVPPADIPVWMSAADALLLPSRAEGSPNVVKEALASELAVVSTPVGDVAERIDGVPACAVRPPDPTELAAALRVAVNHGRVPEARVAAGEVSLRRVAERVVDVYQELIDRHGRVNGGHG